LNEPLRIDELRGIRSLDVRYWTLLSALSLACSSCAEKRTNHEHPPDVAPVLASASATAFASVEPPAPALASAASSASSVPASRLTAADEARFDAAVRGAIERQDIPGAVLVVLRHGEVVFRRAYGVRATVDGEVPMTLDAVFDLASLTKPLATATSILLLAERGKLAIQDPVQKWLPAFRADKRITIEHLLRHTSGLPPGSAPAKQARTPAKALEKILETPLEHAPGEAYVYSDLGYVLLGVIVEKASGETLDVFAKKNMFDPLGMRETTFRPPLALAMRAAPTTPVEEMMMGIVHDPTSSVMGGVAGNAGLFSTVDDITRFVTLLMHKGELDGKAVLSPSIVRQLLDLQPLPGDKEKRSLGLLSIFDGIGHTGFTGTAFWIDPSRDHAVILLTNAVFPDGKKNAKQVRRDVAAAAILMGTKKEIPASAPADRVVRSGIDVLEAIGFTTVEGRKIGLITNHTGKNARGERTIDVLIRHDKLALRALFTPEHGLNGTADGSVGNSKDASTGLPIYSLYGKDKRPPDEAFAELDTLVFDIQDAGTRFYTYITTLGYMMEEAAKRKLRFVILDRPNPLGGMVMEGPLLDANRESFVGYHEIPVRHGMTVAELAMLFNSERKIGADLQVVSMLGYTREMSWSGTGWPWIAPSPNLRSPAEALLYPGIGLLETTNLSVGRGTDHPFERIGAPYIDGAKLATALNQAKLPGVRFSPLRFTPTSSTFVNEACGGVSIEVTNANTLQPVRVGLTIAVTLRKLYPSDWKSAGLLTLLGNAQTFAAFNRGDDVESIVKLYEKDLVAFEKRRSPFLLYR
jgi:uncharacterized protein YbbC (DUF1343 family)/CubicO group peptidase (beta-lactamase class C family)